MTKQHATIREATERREDIFKRLTSERARSGWAHQHELWPCVRKGAAERWLLERGQASTVAPERSAALYFLRGKSAEALIQDSNFPQLLVVVGEPGAEVACTPDQWTGDPLRPFEELKSTNYSSFNFWKLLTDNGGAVDLTQGNEFPMRNYFEQCATYCVALHATGCYLTVYFMHGDYADRRTKCPIDGDKLGPWDEGENRRVCPSCGYTSKKGDLRSYEIDFDPGYLKWVRAEIFGERAPAFYQAIAAPDAPTLLDLAPATQNYHCRTCKAGAAVGCAEAGKAFK